MLRIEGRRYAGKPLTFPTTHADSCSQSTSTASAPISYGSFPSTPHPESSTLTPVPAWRSQPSPSARPGQYGRGQTRPGCSSPRSPAEQRDGQRCRPRTPLTPQAPPLPGNRRAAGGAPVPRPPPPAPPPGRRLTSRPLPPPPPPPPGSPRGTERRPPCLVRVGGAGGGSGGHLQRGQRGGPAVKWRRGAEGK